MTIFTEYLCSIINWSFTIPVGFYFARQRNWDHLNAKKEEDNNNNHNNKAETSNGTTLNGNKAKKLLKSLTAST